MIIHPPDRCGISGFWLNYMISTQVCLGLVIIKGLSKMCSFISGGRGFHGSEMSVSGVTTICLIQCDFRKDVGSLFFDGCAKLLDIGSNGNMLSYTPVQRIILTMTLSVPIAHSLKICDICGIMCNKTAHFIVAFYCDQPKAHLCTNHTV